MMYTVTGSRKEGGNFPRVCSSKSFGYADWLHSRGAKYTPQETKLKILCGLRLLLMQVFTFLHSTLCYLNGLKLKLLKLHVFF